MTIDYGLSHVTFVRVVDLLDATCGLSFAIMTEDEYANSIPEVRKRFLACEVPGYDLERDMKESPGTIRTYRGYLKFLERDLAGSNVMNGSNGKPLSKNGQDKARRVIAKQMLRNGAVRVFPLIVCSRLFLTRFAHLSFSNSPTSRPSSSPLASVSAFILTVTLGPSSPSTCSLGRTWLLRRYVHSPFV